MSPWSLVRTLGQGSLGIWRCLRTQKVQSVFLSDGFRVERGVVPSSQPGPWLRAKSSLLQVRPVYIYLGLAALTLHPLSLPFLVTLLVALSVPALSRHSRTVSHSCGPPFSVSSRSGAGVACPDNYDSLACAIGLPATDTTPSMHAGHVSDDSVLAVDPHWGRRRTSHALIFCT